MNKLLLLFSILVIFSCEKKISSKKEGEKLLTKELQKITKKGLIHGYSVAIVTKDEVLYQKGFGLLGVRKNYTNHTIQKVGSISKVIIGMALLKAQEMGKLNINDPINKYLSFEINNPFFPNEKITLKQLANHTSTIIDTKFYDENVYVLKEDNGFNGIEEMKGVFKSPESKLPMPDFLKKILSKEGDWYLKEGFIKVKPGTTYQYSNVGAALTAHIIEKATGESYIDFTKKYIFTPLKMNSSGWAYSDVDSTKTSNLYYGDNIVPKYKLQTYPDGGLFTSSNDLALLLKDLIKGQSGEDGLLKKESYQKLFGGKISTKTKDFVKNENPALSVKYNSCLFMGNTDSGYFGHTGGDLGLVSLMFFNKNDKFGQLVIVNTHIDGSNEELLDCLWKIWETLDAFKVKL